ncbi:MAG: DUF5662 family protein [Planctomycetaceae bacterium]
MSDPPPEPTAEMVAFFETRTKLHIARVQRCLKTIAPVTDCPDELLHRAQVHDASKYSDAECIPYIWLTEFHRCRQSGEAFTYPDGMEDRVREAVSHHMTTNRHHPDYHATPNAMTDADLIEMVCDWTAMAQEMGECNGSARAYADRTIGSRLVLNSERRDFVYRMIELLDSLLSGKGALEFE